ncbi:protein tyrosine phosphatase [Halobacteriales archaeon QH_2_65_14]|nr:MAG: protein tyrosine phosphatase [Halobacteriales archaeon QH_2_65_14]
MLTPQDSDAVSPPERDGVDALDPQTVTVVSISDIHGYLGDARSALLTLADHPDYDAVVEKDAARRLHWAGGEEYVLVINGDLIDRGPQSERVVEMAERLIEEAPPGHVRVTAGNHEMGVLVPELYDWSRWYSGTRSDEERRAFLQAVLDGHVVAAYEGHNVTYSHAGQPDPFTAREVNEELVEGTQRLLGALGDSDEIETQERVVESLPRVFGYDGETGRGPNAGLTWLDFEYMPEDAPPQVVGHTRQDTPVRRGNVVCGNVIRNNRRKEGGEAVIVETPDSIAALGRDEDGDVVEYVFSLPTMDEPRA